FCGRPAGNFLLHVGYEFPEIGIIAQALRLALPPGVTRAPDRNALDGLKEPIAWVAPNFAKTRLRREVPAAAQIHPRIRPASTTMVCPVTRFMLQMRLIATSAMSSG